MYDMCSLFTQLLYCAPVTLRDCKPLAVSRSNVNVDCTETVVLLVTCIGKLTHTSSDMKIQHKNI